MKPDKNRELMMAAGSKTGAYDIEAPDQWRFVLRHAESPLERAMAWVKSNTTAFRHESPFCVNERRQPLYFRHLAADMGWSDQTAENVLGKLQKQGRVKLKGKRIWYCADVPQAYEESEKQPEEPQPTGRTISERIYSVQSRHGTYVADFIRGLPEKTQIQFLDEDDAWIARKREIFSDLMAAGRMQTDPIEDNMFLRWGLPKKRLPKRRTAEVKLVQVKLVLDPYSVQSTESIRTDRNGDFVDARAVVSTAAATIEAVPPAPWRSSQPVALPKKSPSSSSQDHDDDEKPRKEANKPPEASPEFSAVVRAAFVEHGKPCPTPRQLLNLQESIPVEEEARAAFLPYLLEKLPRIKHPGSLPAVAEEFTAAWPAIAERERILRATLQRSNGPRTVTASDLRAHLEGAASAIPYASIAEPLRNLAADVEQQYKDLSALEERLTVLESDLISQAQANLTKEAAATVEKAIEQQLRPYKGKMTSDQLAMLGKQYRERTVLEVSKLPRLSIFYMHQVAGS